MLTSKQLFSSYMWVTEWGKVSCTKFEMMSSCRESNIKIWLHFIFQYVDLCVLTMYLPKKVLGIRQLHGLRLCLGYQYLVIIQLLN